MLHYVHMSTFTSDQLGLVRNKCTYEHGRNQAILNQADLAKQTRLLVYALFNSVCLMLYEQKAVPHQTRMTSNYNFMSFNLFCTLLVNLILPFY